MLLLVLITGPLIAWVLHRGLAPLRQLATLAGSVSADSWTFNPPSSARDTAELAPVTHALESTLQRLERSFNQQRTFISDAAHELKTAVAVVKSSLQLTGMKPRTLDEYQAGNQRALADTERVEDLVAKMLTLARLETSAADSSFPLANKAADLNRCIARTVSQLETSASVRQVLIVVQSLSLNACTVPLSRDDCSLVLSNLLLNAIQHSPPQSQVELRSTLLGDSVEITVQDHGKGIDAADLPHVFDRFYRADPSRARTTGGTGLGLAICKAAIEKAGGTISLSSNPGKGTIVTIRLRCVLNSAKNQ
jgi:signal transduction histidine kinase